MLWVKTNYTLQLKKIAVLQVVFVMSFMLCLVHFILVFLSPYQDGYKSTNHSKLNDSTCADFMALINLDNYQVEIDSSIVKWSYLDNFKPVYFFFEEKIPWAQKHVTNENQLTKQK